MFLKKIKSIVLALLVLCFFSSLYCEEQIFTMPPSETELNKKLAGAIHYSPQGPNPIGYLHIEKGRAIDESTFLYVKFALEAFKKQKVSFVVLNLDTPGGEVFAAVKIAEELRRLDSQDHIPVVAFIDNWALSAGALLAYSCRFIGIVSSSSMGAAEPVIAGEQGKMESASEKITSALRAEFANAASFFGRNPLLAEAMVDKDIILVQRQGNIIRLESEDQILPEDVMVSRKGKLLTLNSQELEHFDVADFMVPYKALPPLTEEEKSNGVWPAQKYLLFEQAFFSQIPDASLLDYQDWRIQFFAFLSHPLVSSLLMMGLLIGIYGEMSHPGFGVFGMIALVCLGLVLLSSFAVQAIHWLDLIILFTGLALLILEVFILPTFGVAGILGIILTVVGLFAVMLPHLSNVKFSFDMGDWSVGAIELVTRIGYLLGAFVLSLVVIAILARFLTGKRSLWNPFVLKGEQNKEEGFKAVYNSAELPPIGSKGKAFTSLRPSGKVLLHDKLYDAQTEGAFIEKDQPVSVVRHESGKIIVTPDP